MQIESASRALKDRFGLDFFRPGQREIIEKLLVGKSALALFPTGGGKSLCYQLPAVLLPGVTVVVSPLIALMKEQVEKMEALGIGASRLDSTLTSEEVVATVDRIRSGQIKLLYVAPERFFNERFRRLLSELEISLFAIDEAHCISQWGHNFRPDYLRLKRVVEELKIERVLALTATAPPTVLEEICSTFRIQPENVVRNAFFRNNLVYRFAFASSREEKLQLLSQAIGSSPLGASIVYVTQQKSAEEVSDWLNQQGWESQPYHAGLDKDRRDAVQSWFMQTDSGFVVATIAFGMGIDKSNVRNVYHFNPSKSLEAFVQETGRAGRDGNESWCYTFLQPEDRAVLANYAYGDTPCQESLEQLMDLIAHQPNEFYLNLYSIGYQFDIRESVLRTILAYLELDGYLESTTPRYDRYEFKMGSSLEIAIMRLPFPKRKMVKHLIEMSTKRKVYYELDILGAVVKFKSNRDEILDTLHDLDRTGGIELLPKGLLHGFRVLKKIDDVEVVAQQIHQRLSERERAEIERIDSVFQLSTARTCQYQLLAEYFACPMDQACGKCSACQGEFADVPAESKSMSLRNGIGDSALRYLSDAVQAKPEILLDNRIRARFLCGLSSPNFVRYRLSQLPGYGCCDQILFPHVLEAVEKEFG